jgi:hypothetical protein
VTVVDAAEAFAEFVRDVEPRLKHAVVAAFGTEVGAAATQDALVSRWDGSRSSSQHATSHPAKEET